MAPTLPRTMRLRLMTNMLVTEEAAAGMLQQRFPMKLGDLVIDEVQVIGARTLAPELGMELEIESSSARLAAMVGESELAYVSAPPTVRRSA